MKRAQKPTLASLAADLAAGLVTARQLAEQSLARIADPAGEGARAFIHVDAARVMHDADVQDKARRDGKAVSPYAGIPFAIKDLFDVEGEVTTAGSKLLAPEPPAKADSDAVSRMRAAGFVALGRTNMTEFAYSGVGLNPHYGTPLSVYGRNDRRIPGGSSSGSAVAVAEGVCAVALGTDTGGSCRIPAAFNGIVGFKPSAQRVSKKGVYPLSASFDSIGPLANSVACCAITDGILSDHDIVVPQAANGRLRLGLLQDYVLGDLDFAVARDLEVAVARLHSAGHVVDNLRFPDLEDMPSLLGNGGIVGAEAWAHHQAIIARQESEYDPRVVSRIRFGERITMDELARLKSRRAEMIASFSGLAAGFDAIICPTVAMIPPPLADLTTEEGYRRLNALALRNTYVFNFLDACAISLPMHAPGSAPTALMLAQANGRDAHLFSTAMTIETLL